MHLWLSISKHKWSLRRQRCSEFLSDWSEVWVKCLEISDTQILEVQRQQCFDVILILANIVSCGGALCLEEINNTVFYNQKDSAKKYNNVDSNFCCHHKYTKPLFCRIPQRNRIRLSGKWEIWSILHLWKDQILPSNKLLKCISVLVLLLKGLTRILGRALFGCKVKYRKINIWVHEGLKYWNTIYWLLICEQPIGHEPAVFLCGQEDQWYPGVH